MLITFPLYTSGFWIILSIISIDFKDIKSISFASYDATEIAIGGYLRFLPPTAAPTVPEYKTSLPILAPWLIPEITISNSKSTILSKPR